MKSRYYAVLVVGIAVPIACIAGFLRFRGKPADRAPVASYSEQATQFARAGKLTEAVIQFNRAIEIAPAESEPYIGLAVLYESVDRPDLAIEALEQLQAVNPKAKHLTCRLAEAHLGAEDMKAAEDLGEKAVAEEPDSARAYSVCGLAMMAFRYYDTAATMLEKARRLAPEDDEIGQSLLDVTLQQARYAEATELGEQLVSKTPDSARLHYQLGWGYSRETGNKEATARAVTHLQRAIALSPKWFEPCAELGRLYRSLGRNNEAYPYFERAWKLNSTSPGVAYNLAGLLRQRGDPRAAAMEQNYRRLLQGKERFTQMRLYYKSDSENAAKAVALAQSEARNGLYGTALYRLHKLLATNPADLEALKLYIRLDTHVRSRYPNYLRPGPGIGLPRS